MLQFLGDSLSDGSMEQCQMNCQIRVFVRDIHEYLAHIQRDGQFLLTCFLVSPGSTLPPTNSHSSPLALWAGRWQIMNLSPSQIRAATTSVTIFQNTLSHLQGLHQLLCNLPLNRDSEIHALLKDTNKLYISLQICKVLFQELIQFPQSSTLFEVTFGIVNNLPSDKIYCSSSLLTPLPTYLFS